MDLNEPSVFERDLSALVVFLEAHLDLAFTILRTAEISKVPDEKIAGIENVRKGLGTVRQLQGLVSDPEVWKRIHDRANHLEDELSAFSKTA